MTGGATRRDMRRDATEVGDEVTVQLREGQPFPGRLVLPVTLFYCPTHSSDPASRVARPGAYPPDNH
jgi:hypothetical protein